MAYVWFRFEWQFALGGVVALTHDVLVTAGIFSLFQFEFDLSTVAALLTILGYSVNDTVVVSDRIRENLRKFKKMELNDLLNLSINETLSRTILTGMTAIAVLLALYIFGGEVIRNFNLAMLLGVIIGTYSSIFIAAPLLGYLGVKRDWSDAAAKTVAASKSKAKV
jgi:preprotein translocase subunit SecF/SecD/SecF fusion protein